MPVSSHTIRSIVRVVLSIPRSVTFSDPSRYDLLLAVIPTAFLLALLAGSVLSMPPQVTLAIASLVGVMALADGLFRNPPTAGSNE